MQRLLLVRHAAPIIGSSVASEEWVLSPEGEEAAEQLALALASYGSLPVYASPEAKAVHTARPIARQWGVEVGIERDLREVRGRPWVDSRAEYEETVGRYLRGEAVDGWEERTGARRRIATAVEKLMGPDQDVLVVSHGLVFVLWLSWLLKVEPDTLFPVWRTIRFPDLCIVDWKAGDVVRPFGEPL